MTIADIERPILLCRTKLLADVIEWLHAGGGHFAAMEQPEALAHELREFFRPLRASVA